MSSGITNTIGRILSGWLADLPRVNALLLHNVMMIVGGLACIANMWCTTYPLMIVFSAVFGLSVGKFSCFFPSSYFMFVGRDWTKFHHNYLY